MPERRLAIVGYGKMGRLVDQLAPEYGFDVALKLDEYNNANYEGVTAENFRGIDVAVDFSIPAAVAGKCAQDRGAGHQYRGGHNRLAGTGGAGARGGGAERDRAGVESEFLDRGQHFYARGGGSGAADGG